MTPVIGNFAFGTVNGANNVTFSHNNNGSIVIVRLCGATSTTTLISGLSVTYAGFAMTQIGIDQYSIGSSYPQVFVYILLGAPGGANNVVMSWTNNIYAYATAQSISNANYRTPLVTSQQGTSVGGTVTTVAGDLVIEAACAASAANDACSITGGQSSELNSIIGTYQSSMHTYKVASGVSTAMTWSITNSESFAQVLIPFYDPGGGTPIAMAPAMMF